MSKLPYLCDFRFVIHVWITEKDPITKEEFDWSKPSYELFMEETWCKGFNFLPKKLPSKVFMFDETSRTNPIASRKAEYGMEILGNGELIDNIIEAYLKLKLKPNEEKYYEVVGKIHEYTWQCYEGDWDSECEVSAIKFQELDEKDINWLWDKTVV